jgi:hypothetical protein
MYGCADKVTRMKTTIELPDALAEQARIIARQQNVTLRELVTEGLRAEIERRSVPRQARPFRFRSVGGQGLHEDVAPQSLTRLAYDLPS